jgi:hypothetical protein
MSEDRKANEDRRRFLKIAGSGAALVPIIGLAGCSGGNDSAPAAASKPMTDATTAAKDAARSMESEAKSAADEVKAAAPSAADMPRLSVDDPQAKSLSYVEDATAIDRAKQPRYQPGQACANCALFQNKDGAEWAGCSIFPGKLVAAAGWCSVYAPKPA